MRPLPAPLPLNTPEANKSLIQKVEIGIADAQVGRAHELAPREPARFR
jgi:hypothetical protein